MTNQYESYTHQDGDDLVHRERGRSIKGDDFCVRMQRAQHRGMGGAGTPAHIVGEAPAPDEQRCVVDALHFVRV